MSWVVCSFLNPPTAAQIGSGWFGFGVAFRAGPGLSGLLGIATQAARQPGNAMFVQVNIQEATLQ